MQDLWTKHGPLGSKLTKTELMAVLTNIVDRSSLDLYLVFDALDKCSFEIRSQLLAILGELLCLPAT